MTARPSPGDEAPGPYRVDVSHLDEHELLLLRALLRGGDVPFGIVRGELVAGIEHTDEVDEAVAWVAVGNDRRDPDLADAEHRSARPPLVPPSRPPLVDGRRQATRWRRLTAGLIDHAIAGLAVAALIAWRVPAWTAAIVHLVCFVALPASYGWTLGKLCTGLRLVDRRTLRTPGVPTVTERWLVADAVLLAVIVFGLNGNWATFALLAVYLPIVADLRGLHDRAAGTLVVERSVDGPGIFVKARPIRDPE